MIEKENVMSAYPTQSNFVGCFLFLSCVLLTWGASKELNKQQPGSNTEISVSTNVVTNWLPQKNLRNMHVLFLSFNYFI